MAYDIGPKIGIEGEAEFRQAINGINTNLKTLGTEMMAVTSKFDKNEKSTESLTEKNKVLNKQIDEQKSKLSELEKGLSAAADKYGENDKVTQGWRQAVNKATADLNNMQREVESNTKAINEFGSETQDTTNKTNKFSDMLDGLGKGLSNIGKVVGPAAVLGIKAIGAATVATVTGMVGLTESTKEYRNDLSKLEQNATTAGNSFNIMKEELSGLNALTGETDSSIEALSNLMATGFSDNQITQAVDALSGAVIKFPDTLKMESLSDSLQETIATGAATGQFSELIGRLGGNVETFNKSMEGATTQAERQQVALDFLSKSGLTELNAQYKETKKNMLSASEAQFKLNDSMANLATAVEPTIATMKGGLADILSNLVDVVTGTDGATKKFSESITTFATNLLTQVTNIIPTISTTLEALVPSIVTGIVEALPLLAQAAVNIVSTLVASITNLLPQLVPAAVGILQTLVTGITQSIPNLIPAVISIVTGLADMITNNIGTIVDMGISLILALVQGIADSLPSLLVEVPRIINEFSNTLYAQLPKILQAGIQIIGILAKGIIDSIPTLVANIPQIILAIVNVITLYNWWNLGSSVITKIGDGISGMKGNIGTIAKELAESVLKGIKNIFSGGVNIGKYLIEGLWNGITGAKDWLLSNVKDFAVNLIGIFANAWGIASPSKVMTEYGKFLDEGLAIGINGNANKPIGAMNSVAGSINQSLQSITDTIGVTTEAIKNMASAATMSQIISFNNLSSEEQANRRTSNKNQRDNFYIANKDEINAISKRQNVDIDVAQDMLRKNFELGIPKYANGTNFHPGGLAWVGEYGKELIELPRGSKVYTNKQSTEITKIGEGIVNGLSNVLSSQTLPNAVIQVVLDSKIIAQAIYDPLKEVSKQRGVALG